MIDLAARFYAGTVGHIPGETGGDVVRAIGQHRCREHGHAVGGDRGPMAMPLFRNVTLSPLIAGPPIGLGVNVAVKLTVGRA